MSAVDHALLRHLATAVGVKVVVLAALWCAFVRDAHVAVDAGQTAAHVAGAPSGPGAKP